MENNKSEVHVLFIVLRALGVILSLLGIGIGVLYFLHGQLVFSIVLALFLVAPFVILSEVLKNLKIKERKSPYCKPEYIGGALYAVFFVVALFFFAHFWNIELSKKDDLKRAGLNRLEEIKTMQNSYESFVTMKIQSYKDSLETATGSLFLATNAADINKYIKELDNLLGEGKVDYSKYMAYQNDSTIKNNILNEIELAKSDKIDLLNDKYDLGKANTDFVEFYNRATTVFNKWKMFELSKTFYDIDIEYSKLLELTKLKSNNEFSYKDLEQSYFRIDNPFDISANFFVALIIFALLNWLILSVYHKIDRYEYPFPNPPTVVFTDTDEVGIKKRTFDHNN